MKNPSNKIKNAVTIIRKFYRALNVERTDSEDVVYLFDYSTKKKTVGSPVINKAVELAMKQQDWPKVVVYQNGMLAIPNEAETVETVETVIEAVEPITEEQPIKKTRKKKSETEDETEA